MITGKDDGKVSVKSASLRCMKELKVIHTTHPLMMKHKGVIEYVTEILKKES